MTAKRTRKLPQTIGERIASDLFFNGLERADHLELRLRGRYLSGWSESAMANQINAMIREAMPTVSEIPKPSRKKVKRGKN